MVLSAQQIMTSAQEKVAQETVVINIVKSLIFVWVLFSRGCSDCENKSREYENI
jgi:hypothetical protein